MSELEYKSLAEQLDRIEKMTLLGAKKALTISDVSLLTGLSKDYIYRLTSTNKIPHYKPTDGKLYFNKKEVEDWLLSNRKSTKAEINSSASLHTFINK